MPGMPEMTQASYGLTHFCCRNRGRSDSTYGSPGAGAPAPEPVPAAAQRRPKFLWQPAASQPVWLIPLTLGQTWARVECASERGQAEKPLRIRPLQSNPGGLKTALMKKNPSSEQARRLDNTPKWDVIQICIITCSAVNASRRSGVY